jgi:signal peptidase I
VTGRILTIGAVVGLLLALDRVRRRWVVVRVDGVSMLPTLRPGDRVLVRRVSAADLRPGQAVVLQRQAGADRWDTAPLPVHRVGRGGWYIKRIVAAQGDPVPPGAVPGVGVPAGTPVPPGKLVVFGDNAAASADSRQWGFAPADRVLGVVVRRLEPAG